MELEKTVEPTWPKLVEPLERIIDRFQVVWGVVNHLKSVKDSSELRSAIEEIQVIGLNYSSCFCKKHVFFVIVVTIQWMNW